MDRLNAQFFKASRYPNLMLLNLSAAARLGEQIFFMSYFSVKTGFSLRSTVLERNSGALFSSGEP